MSSSYVLETREEIATDPIAPETLPLTVAQRGVWIGDKISRDGTVFNIAEMLRIHGRVDRRTFITALWEITKEVETTRTNIFEDASGPRQLIHPSYQGFLPFKDFSNSDDALASAQDWMLEDVKKPVDIERDPLWFSALLKISDDEYVWYHRAHHVIFDGFSGGLVARRLAEIYNALLIGEQPPESDLKPLKNLVDDEIAYRASNIFERDRQYWQERLANYPDPVSFAQGRRPTSNGLARKSLQIGSERTAKLRLLSKEYGCSMPQMLIALTSGFIYRATGSKDLVIGMPVTARVKSTRNTPGMAANGTLLRLAMDSGLDLASLAQQTAREVRHALRRQRYRFEDIRRDFGLTGQHDHLARLAINIEPFDYDLKFGGHKTTAHNLANSSVEDMVIFIYDRGDEQGLRIDLDANPSLYSDTQLETYVLQFERWITAIMENPESQIGDIDILLECERDKLLNLWNDTDRPTPEKFSFELFEENAKTSPNAAAMSFEDRVASYSDLNGRSNYAARRILANDIGTKDVVALALPKSISNSSAIIGVLKAGAVFLPLNPDDPCERCQSVILDAQVKAVITDKDHMEKFSAMGVKTLLSEDICAGTDPVNIRDEERRLPLRLTDPAYIIYTSGSTGTPKGALLAHAGLTNMLIATIESLSLGPDDNLCGATPLTFDVSVLNLLAPLVAGSTFVEAPMHIVREPLKLAIFMRQNNITAMAAPPSLWEALIGSRAAPLVGLKAVSGGEVLTSNLARKLRDLGADVFNQYGPTEGTVYCIGTKVSEKDVRSPNIGRPIRNMRAYVLDDDLNLLPIGALGELCISGIGVALEYVNKSELTAKSFLKDPFRNDGTMLYKTGDLVRWTEKGELEFLGRRDNQLKIRGFRIEPGEVEAAFLAIDGVDSAHVRSLSNRKGGKRLAAYIAGNGKRPLNEIEIRNAIRQKLPDHLIPSSLFIIDKIPLTRHGKIDVAALPTTECRTVAGYVAPRTETEKRITEIFCSMLSVDRIGVEDNLFDLGADSLTAVQLLLEIEAQFSIKLSLLSLFDAPTIASLAQQMDDETVLDPFDTIFPIRKKGNDTPLFCIHSVIGVSWSYAGLLRHMGPQCPIYALQARGLNSKSQTVQPDSIDAMANDYLEQIRSIQPTGPYRLLGWSFGGLVAHALTAKLEAQGEDVEFLCLLDSFPFASSNQKEQKNEISFVDEVLNFVGYSPNDHVSRPKDLNSLTQYIFREFDIFSMPIIDKAALGGEDVKTRFQNVIANNFTIGRKYKPSIIEADIHILRAGTGKDEELYSIVEHQTGSWKRFTNGAVEERDMPCHHFAMLNNETLEEIGPYIRSNLDQLHDHLVDS